MWLMAKKTQNTSVKKQFYMKEKGDQKKSKLKPTIFLQSEKENENRKKRAKGKLAKNYGKRKRKQGSCIY